MQNCLQMDLKFIESRPILSTFQIYAEYNSINQSFNFYCQLLSFSLIKNPTFCIHKMKELKAYPFWFFAKLMFAYNTSKV